LAKVLGKALLWLIFSPSSDCLPDPKLCTIMLQLHATTLPNCLLVNALQRKLLLSSHKVQAFGRAALWHCSGVRVAARCGVKQATGDER
jgi:hypothetical protein